MPETVLLPFDGTDRTACTDYALDRAEREEGVVCALGVVDTPRYGEPALSSAEVVVDEIEDEVRAQLATVARRGADRGVGVETHCCHGHFPEELLDYARQVDADVLVCGRRLPYAVRTRLDGVVDAVVSRPETRAIV